MFFPQKMLRVKVFIPKEDVYTEVHCIGKNGSLHVDTTHKNIFFSNLQNKTHLLLQTAQKYLDTLKIKERINIDKEVSSFEHEIEDTQKNLKDIGLKIEKLSTKKDWIEKVTSELKIAQRVDKALSEIDLKSLPILQMFELKIAIVPKEFFEFFELSVDNYPVFHISSNFTKGTVCVAIFHDKQAKENIENILEKIEATSVELDYFKQEYIDSINKKNLEFQKEFYLMLDEYKNILLEEEAKLNMIYKQLAVESVLVIDENGFRLYGWIPKSKKTEFEKSLKSSTVEFSDALSVAPVLLKTPKLFKPFEELIENFSYPSYTEINPTILFAFTFLTMFGMMFGDIGHGAVLAVCGYVLSKRIQKYSVLLRIMISAGISAMFFGFLYGSVFGFHDIFPHLIISPMENIGEIFSYSLSLGIFIITLSMGLNIFSRFREKNFYRLFFGSGGLLWLLVYWFLIGISVKYILYNLSVKLEIYLVITILIVLFIMFLYKSKNITKTLISTAMEVMEYATNTISFIRLGAFTLAHAALFLALFSVADVISSNTQVGLGYWLTIFIGNIIIIVLEGVVVTIQTLRLEYYEFFKRFYQGGGEKYKPFTLKEDENEKSVYF